MASGTCKSKNQIDFNIANTSIIALIDMFGTYNKKMEQHTSPH